MGEITRPRTRGVVGGFGGASADAWETSPVGTFRFDQGAVSIAPTRDIVLQRLPLTEGDHERFVLHRRITYEIPPGDPGGPFTYTVPPDDEPFVTDLASVPQLLTWLVPKSGRHLPAALVHDAMVRDPGIDRFDADRIFRDAMGDLGVRLIRRWLMWTAVSLKTIHKRGTASLRVAAVVTILAVALLGSAATTSLFVDRTLLPWMGSRHWLVELIFGLAGALAIPAALGILLWRPIRTAGVIAGVTAAVLLHVMALLTALYGLYLALENLGRRSQLTLAIIVSALALGLFGYAVWSSPG